MNEKQLVNGLVHLNGKPLRMVYSFLHKTKPQHVLNKTTKEDMANYLHFLEQESERLLGLEDQKIQLDIWLEILRLLHIKINTELDDNKISQLNKRIVNEVYSFYKRQEEFEEFLAARNNKDPLTIILLYQIKLQMQRFSFKLKKENVHDIHFFMQEIENLVENITRKSNNKESLNIDDNPSLDEIIITILETYGIHYYPDILQLIWKHGVNMKIFQGEKNSEIEPIYILMLPILNVDQVEPKDVRNFLQVEYFKKNLIPNLLLQLYMVNLINKETGKYNLIKEEWSKRTENYKALYVERENSQKEIADLEKEIETNQIKLKDIYAEWKLIGNQIKADKATIYNALKYADVTELDVNWAFEVHRREFLAIQLKINQLLYEKYRYSNNDGFLTKLKSKISNVGTTIQIQNEKRKLDYYLKEMTEDLLASNSEFKIQERMRIKEAESRLEKLKEWQKQHQEYQKILKSDLTKSKARLWKIKKELKDLEKKHYGLKDSIKEAQAMYLDEPNEDD